jgi:hypothetical protein
VENYYPNFYPDQSIIMEGAENCLFICQISAVIKLVLKKLLHSQQHFLRTPVLSSMEVH